MATFSSRGLGWLVGGVIGCSLAVVVSAFVQMPTAKEIISSGELEGVGERLRGNGSAMQAVLVAGPRNTGAESAARASKPVTHATTKVTARPHRPAAPTPTPDQEREAALRTLREVGPNVRANPAGLLAAVGRVEPSRAIEAFLKLGLDDLEAAGPGGRTVLMQAAERGDIAWLNFLGDHCVQLNRTDDHGHSALHLAVQAKSVPAVTWLIQRGATASGDCCEGKSSLLAHACESRNVDIAKPILKEIEVFGPLEWSPITREAFFTAVRERDKAFVQLLMQVHADPVTLEGSRHPLLAYTIAWGDIDVLRFLLDCGADPNTPVGSPAERDFVRLISSERVRYYLEKDRGLSPLMFAAALGRLDCVEALLQYRASRGKTSGHYKMAAISFAAQTNRTDIMQLLLGKSPRPEDQRVRVNISLSRQRVVLWRDNQVVFSSSVSTGKPGYSTPTGSYVITDKQRSRFSTIYKVEMPYFMRLSCSEVGMHAGVVPPYPASHGCIRLPYGAAVRFYREVEPGTLVTISH